MIKLLKSIWRWFFPVKTERVIEANVPYKIVHFRKQQLIGKLILSRYNRHLWYFRVMKRLNNLTYKLELQ